MFGDVLCGLFTFFRASLFFIFPTLPFEIHGLFHEGSAIGGDLWNQSLHSKENHFNDSNSTSF